jgi:hypothetical protein
MFVHPCHPTLRPGSSLLSACNTENNEETHRATETVLLWATPQRTHCHHNMNRILDPRDRTMVRKLCGCADFSVDLAVDMRAEAA